MVESNTVPYHCAESVVGGGRSTVCKSLTKKYVP